MEARKPSNGAAKGLPLFDAQAFLDSSGVAKTVVQYGRGEVIFTQGDACEHVMYIQVGRRQAVGAVEDRQGGRGGDARPG